MIKYQLKIVFIKSIKFYSMPSKEKEWGIMAELIQFNILMNLNSVKCIFCACMIVENNPPELEAVTQLNVSVYFTTINLDNIQYNSLQ